MSNSTSIPEVNILGVRLHNVDTAETLAIIDAFIRDGSPHQICTPNVDFIIQAQKDTEFLEILNRAHLSVPDGMGVVYASRFLGTPLKENVKGRILVIRLCRQASERRQSVFFLGGEPGVATKAAEILKQRFPDLKVAGTISPSFQILDDEQENRKVLDELNRCRPDILFVGMGAPKQEKWIARNLSSTQQERPFSVPVSLGIGGTFDIISGRIREAPSWMTNVGLEWSFRLAREPGRLWKRYLVRDPKFFWKIVEQKIRSAF